jgi:hypothetical protein
LAVLNHKRALAAVLLIACALIFAACGSPPPLRLRYLPGIVAGSQRIFHPAHIGIFPTQVMYGGNRLRVGAVYAPDGTKERLLFVDDFGAAVTQALTQALGDAGLDPVIVKSPSSARLPDGVDYLLVTTVKHVSIDKRFGSEMTVHGRYFTMHARVELAWVLSSRAAPDLAKGTIIGTEDEPPAPVHREVFLPLETDPAESLSVAMSRAVGELMISPGFQQALPVIARAVPAPVPSVSSGPAATPTPASSHM